MEGLVIKQRESFRSNESDRVVIQRVIAGGRVQEVHPLQGLAVEGEALRWGEWVDSENEEVGQE